MGTGSLSLLDYRRRVAQLYADIRETAVRRSPREAHELWRTTRDQLYATHVDSPLLPDDPRRRTGLPVAPYDPDLRFTAVLHAADHAQELRVTTGTDGEVVFSLLGRARTPLGTLDLWWLSGYGGGVWLPVRDGSSGTSSYGGGRYLLDTVKGADLGTTRDHEDLRDHLDEQGEQDDQDDDGERLVLDLNFLYNPSCAYDPTWACPLAPPGNRLDAAVDAGELV
ncbi:DUF1684 domain-containing protein [Quadrisphaera granulorum]|uniref:DUF1684 domain-containing protein n=1 Tax=Quadrisphaera granulorum TaxID=317664 RepID=UPI001FE365E9|nr:DUF1684 domain-containing protein [Quadrisphaera granulorum]